MGQVFTEVQFIFTFLCGSNIIHLVLGLHNKFQNPRTVASEHWMTISIYKSSSIVHCFQVITNSFPLVTKICQRILKYENLTFLPEDVTAILEEMIILKNRYNVLARERTVPRKKPEGKSAECQVYPLFPVHTVKNVHSADKKPDKT